MRQERWILKLYRGIGARKEHAPALTDERLQRLPHEIDREAKSLKLIDPAVRALGEERLERDRATAMGGQVTVPRNHCRHPDACERTKALALWINAIEGSLGNPLRHLVA
jgi:hypothetical protein